MATRKKLASRLMVATAMGAALLNPYMAQAASLSVLPDLSGLLTFATFGGNYKDSNVTVVGNSGISANGKLVLDAPSSITGNLSLGTGATKTGPGTIGGTTFTNQNLTLAQSQVYAASTTLAGLTPDYNLGNVTTSQTFASTGGVTVINMNTLTLGSGQSITFSGGANDYFVLNLRDMDLTGDATIGNLSSASHVLVNFFDNSGGDLGTVAHVGNVVNGTILIPYDPATFHSVTGAIFSGTNNKITLMSGATVTGTPFTPVPVPAALVLLLSGLGLFGFAGHSKRQKSAS